MNEPHSSGWGPCPPGEIYRLAAKLAFRKALVTIVAAGTVLIAGAGVAVAVWYVAVPLSRPAVDSHEGINKGEKGERMIYHQKGSRK